MKKTQRCREAKCICGIKKVQRGWKPPGCLPCLVHWSGGWPIQPGSLKAPILLPSTDFNFCDSPFPLPLSFPDNDNGIIIFTFEIFFFFYHSASAACQQDFIKKREYIQKYLLASAFCFSDSLNEIMFLSCLFLHTEMTDNVSFVPFKMNRVEKCSLSSRNTSWQIYRSLYHCWQRIKGKSVHYLSPLWQVHINLGSRLISDSLSIWSLRLKAKSPFQVTLFYVFKFKIFQLMYLIVQKMKFTIGNSWNF